MTENQEYGILNPMEQIAFIENSAKAAEIRKQILPVRKIEIILPEETLYDSWKEANMGLLPALVTGALCGWIAGKLMRSRHGLILNIIIGLLGGTIGGFLFGLLGLSASGWGGQVLVSVVGACVLIWVCRRL